jgi:hypothetical protein
VIETRNDSFIKSVISSFTRQNENLIKVLMTLQYYFRGSITRESALMMSHAERELAIEFLNQRFDDAKDMIKQNIPVFL